MPVEMKFEDNELSHDYLWRRRNLEWWMEISTGTARNLNSPMNGDCKEQ
jgi:hypothetical protein